MPDGAGLVCGVSHAEFYKHYVFSIEVSGLMFLF